MKTRFLHIFIAVALISQLSFALDYYKVLEINRDATDKDITKAFRRLSLLYHPDKNPGDQEAAQKFIHVNKAYEALSDPDLRRIYDLRGEEGLESHFKGEDVDQFGNRRKGGDYRFDIRVTLEDFYIGVTRDVPISRAILCPVCRGTGAKDGKTVSCPHCGGKGVRLERVQMGTGFTMQMQTPCNYCGGLGRIVSEPCPHCRGRKTIIGSVTLKAEIEKGMKDGQKLTFERMSEQSPDYTPGDVIIALRQDPHPRFRRVGDNLYYDLSLTFKEAMLGFKKTVKHLDQHFTEISSQNPSQPLSVKIIKGEGMPVHNEHDTFGDMHVKLKVTLPRTLTEQDKELLKKIFELDPK